MSTTDISCNDNVIDSRDVIARIEELQDMEARDEEEELQLAELQALASEAEGSPDWEHGETLIRDSYFEDYARELAEDVGAFKGTEGWPLNCIDWERAARKLQQDYTQVEFNGVAYWIRS